jgi:hypothetical protein
VASGTPLSPVSARKADKNAPEDKNSEFLSTKRLLG